MAYGRIPGVAYIANPALQKGNWNQNYWYGNLTAPDHAVNNTGIKDNKIDNPALIQQQAAKPISLHDKAESKTETIEAGKDEKEETRSRDGIFNVFIVVGIILAVILIFFSARDEKPVE
jgi:hypothetical protein